MVDLVVFIVKLAVPQFETILKKNKNKIIKYTQLDTLYVSLFIAMPCQVVYTDVYMLDDEMKWKVLPPMPKPNSHIEFAWVLVNNSIVIVGGTMNCTHIR